MGSMVLVYMLTCLGGILMGSMLPYIAYMDPMGYIYICIIHLYIYNNAMKSGTPPRGEFQ